MENQRATIELQTRQRHAAVYDGRPPPLRKKQAASSQGKLRRIRLHDVALLITQFGPGAPPPDTGGPTLNGAPPTGDFPGAFPPGASGVPNRSPPSGQTNPSQWKPLPVDAKQPSSDPRNFEGTWSGQAFLLQIAAMYGGPIPFNDIGRKVYERRRAANKAGTPFIHAPLPRTPN